MENELFENMTQRITGEHMAFEQCARLMRKYRSLYNKSLRTIYIQRVIILALTAVALGAWLYAR